MMGGGYSYNCDATGKLIGDDYKNAAERQAEMDENLASGLFHAPVIEECHNRYIEPAVGRCTCGSHVTLADPLDNQCDSCGRWYNMVGQSVTGPAREMPEWDYDY